MAKSATFQIKNNTNVYIGTEATMGTPSVADAALVELPVTDYSFSELGAGGQSLNVAPFRVGGGLTQSDDMVKAQRHDRMYEVSVTFMCTNAATKRVLLNLYEDGSVSNDLSVLIGSMPSTLLFEHGQPNTIPVSLIFRDLGHDSTSDMIFKSCMATSLTFSGDIGGNGGVVMCTAVFQTAYKPIASTDLAYSSITTVSDQDTMFNMHDLSTTEITPSGGSAEDLLLYSFELNIARTVTRVGFDASTDFNPMGYALGGYEVTGSLNAKRDSESVTAIAEGNTPFALDLDTTVYQILAPTCFIDNASISFDEDGFKQVIPFRATYTGATTSTIFSFAGKTEDT
tara:strand:+ start:509 stop:1534 length:1026 start_codon:yes stop_codon:yes gene_type:complete